MNDSNFNLSWLTKLKKDIIHYHKLMGNKGNWPRYALHPYMDIEYFEIPYLTDIPRSFLIVRLDDSAQKIVLFYPTPPSNSFSSGYWSYILGERNAENQLLLSEPKGLTGLKLPYLTNDASSFLSMFKHKEDGRGKEFMFEPTFFA